MEIGDVVIGGLAQLAVEPFITPFFRQGGGVGEQVGAKTQTVALDGAAQSGQGGGQQIHTAVFPVFGIVGGDGGAEDAVVDHPLIILVHIPLEIAVVHGKVVAGDDHGGVFPPALFLHPLHKFQHLTAGAGDGLLVGFCVFIGAVGALVAADVMGVHGE